MVVECGAAGVALRVLLACFRWGALCFGGIAVEFHPYGCDVVVGWHGWLCGLCGV